MEAAAHRHKLRRLGIDTQREFIIYLRKDCQVCISEGFQALTRLEVHFRGKEIIATLNIVESELLGDDEASLSESAWSALGVMEGDEISLRHLAPIESYNYVKQKILGRKLTPSQYRHIIEDVVDRKFSNTQLSAFLTACASSSMTTEEIVGLTQAMIDTGERISWDDEIVADKHCIGGLAGNRTTPIVVSICAAAGMRIPKTSSRAITSPAGTADTMEVFTRVDLSMDEIRKVVVKEGACMAWGGAIRLSPADDILIRVERTIDLDSEGQMIASILSKKVSAGSTHVLIDIPLGSDQKVTTRDDAELLKERFELVGMALGMKLSVVITDGKQPVGNGIGPVLEAMDVLKVLKNEEDAPSDLREKSVKLSGELLLLAGKDCDNIKSAESLAWKILSSGQAFEKFKAICLAQGRYEEPAKLALCQETIYAERSGRVGYIHSTKLARIAKLAGAPQDREAGVLMHKKLGDLVKKNEPLYTVYSDAAGELAYALEYAGTHNGIYEIR